MRRKPPEHTLAKLGEFARASSSEFEGGVRISSKP
jgi:hypothetical protein